jgi:hypothetical protein
MKYVNYMNVHFVKKEMKRLILAFIILFSQRILYRWC